MLEILEKYFEVKKVLKNGEISYLQVFPNNKDAKELFIYNEGNIDRQYIPIDDDHRNVIKLDNILSIDEQEVATELMELLGEEINTYYQLEGIDDEDIDFIYDNFMELLEDYDIDLPLSALDVLDEGNAIIANGGFIIQEIDLSEIQFLEMADA